METKGFFSKPNLGGIDPEDFHNSLKFANLKAQFLKHLQDEIDLLTDFINRTNTGGWSTHLNDDMSKRITKLKEIHYAVSVR
jgi:hypothetical protein